MVNTNNVVTNNLNPLVGTWKLKRDTLILNSSYENYSHIVASDGKDTCYGYFAEYNINVDSITFNSDSTFSGDSPNRYVTGRWGLNNSGLIIDSLRSYDLLYGHNSGPSMTYWAFKISKSNELKLISPCLFQPDDCDPYEGSLQIWEIDYVKVK